MAAVVGLVVGIVNPFLSHAASTQGALIDTLFSLTLGIAAAIFVIVQGFLLYSVIRFGRDPDDETDAAPIRGNHKLKFFWTAIPAVVLVAFGLLSYRVLADIERPRADDLVVEVTGQQYAWQFYYPDQDITTTELHIPLNQQVHLKLRSKDVIHSFWVPEFRIKKDVMPDRVTDAYITGSVLGAYPIVCTELCGAGHTIIRGQVVVESDASFQQWLAGQGVAKAQAAQAAAADPLAAGKAAFNTYGCNACHTLASAGASARSGPSWTASGHAQPAPSPAKPPKTTSAPPSSSRAPTWSRTTQTSCRRTTSSASPRPTWTRS